MEREDMYISKETLKALKNHNEEAFNTFYKNYKNLLFFIIVSIVKNEDIAKELLQDSLIKIYNNVPNLQNDNSFHSYVSLVAKNIALDYLKKQKFVSNADVDVILATQIQQPTEAISFSFNEYLTDIEKIVVTYHVIYDFSFKEIAQMINMNISTIYNHYSNAKSKMKQFYKKEGHL